MMCDTSNTILVTDKSKIKSEEMHIPVESGLVRKQKIENVANEIINENLDAFIELAK